MHQAVFLQLQASELLVEVVANDAATAEALSGGSRWLVESKFTMTVTASRRDRMSSESHIGNLAPLALGQANLELTTARSPLG